MKVYFDTEFTGLQKDTDLISVGLVSEDGKEFYAEFTDFDRYKCDEWIEENVLKNTVHYGSLNIPDIVTDESNYHLGTKEDIKEQLVEWLNQFDYIDMYSDVCHYDYVLFIDIFGGAFDLPNKIPACCHDINQDIASYYKVTDSVAFDISREEILIDFGQNIIGEKHNSLYDARVIQLLYHLLQDEIE